MYDEEKESIIEKIKNSTFFQALTIVLTILLATSLTILFVSSIYEYANKPDKNLYALQKDVYLVEFRIISKPVYLGDVDMSGNKLLSGTRHDGTRMYIPWENIFAIYKEKQDENGYLVDVFFVDSFLCAHFFYYHNTCILGTQAPTQKSNSAN